MGHRSSAAAAVQPYLRSIRGVRPPCVCHGSDKPASTSARLRSSTAVSLGELALSNGVVTEQGQGGRDARKFLSVS